MNISHLNLHLFVAFMLFFVVVVDQVAKKRKKEEKKKLNLWKSEHKSLLIDSLSFSVKAFVLKCTSQCLFVALIIGWGQTYDWTLLYVVMKPSCACGRMREKDVASVLLHAMRDICKSGLNWDKASVMTLL